MCSVSWKCRMSWGKFRHSTAFCDGPGSAQGKNIARRPSCCQPPSDHLLTIGIDDYSVGPVEINKKLMSHQCGRAGSTTMSMSNPVGQPAAVTAHMIELLAENPPSLRSTACAHESTLATRCFFVGPCRAPKQFSKRLYRRGYRPIHRGQMVENH